MISTILIILAGVIGLVIGFGKSQSEFLQDHAVEGYLICTLLAIVSAFFLSIGF